MIRVATLCLLIALPAGAADPEAEAQVQTLGKRAVERFAAGDHVAALQAFRDAESWLAKLPERRPELAIVRFNIGRCLQKLDRPEEALEAYRSVSKADFKGKIEVLEARIATLKATIFGSIEVACADASVQIRGVDGTQPCGGRWPEIKPGRYQLVASFEGGDTATVWSDVVAGEVARVELERPVPAPAPVVVVEEPPPPPPPPSRVLEWTLTAGAGGLLVGGAVTHLLALRALEDEQTLYDEWSEGHDPFVANEAQTAANEARVLAISTYVLYGLGAAAAVGAAVTWSADDSGPSVAVSPGGLQLRARW